MRRCSTSTSSKSPRWRRSATRCELILAAHDPYPAVVIEAWEMLACNRAVGLLVEGVAPELLEPPVNVLRLSLHPDGVAPRIVNLGSGGNTCSTGSIARSP